MIADLTTLLRGAAYLAFEDGTNDYTTAPKAAYVLEAQAARIAELEALLKRADDIANWTGEDLICAGRSYASVVQAYKNDRAALKGEEHE